jgi:hypothetical protein
LDLWHIAGERAMEPSAIPLGIFKGFLNIELGKFFINDK